MNGTSPSAFWPSFKGPGKPTPMRGTTGSTRAGACARLAVGHAPLRVVEALMREREQSQYRALIVA
jgi:hypothetical protein